MYIIASILKIILWLSIMLLLYTMIYPQQDPLLALSLGFLALLLVSWWISFFLFLLWNWGMWYIQHIDESVVHSYKVSLLFALCIILNGLLIMSGWRNRWIWLLSFVWALWLQTLLTRNIIDPDDTY